MKIRYMSRDEKFEHIGPFVGEVVIVEGVVLGKARTWGGTLLVLDSVIGGVSDVIVLSGEFCVVISINRLDSVRRIGDAA